MKMHKSRMARKRDQQKSWAEREEKLDKLCTAALSFLPASSLDGMTVDNINTEFYMLGHYNVPITTVLEKLQKAQKIIGSRTLQGRTLVDVWNKRR